MNRTAHASHDPGCPYDTCPDCAKQLLDMALSVQEPGQPMRATGEAIAKRRTIARQLGDACREFLEEVGEPIEKASPTDPFWRQLHRIADKAEPQLKRKILEAIAATVKNVDGDALERALARGNTEGALRAINWTGNGDPQLRAAYQTILGDAYAQAGEATARYTERELSVPAVFDLDNPRATAWAETVAATRVVQVTDETIDALRAMVERGFREAIHPRDLARMIRGVKDVETGQYKNSLIGLTERQANAVWNYRSALENDEIERSQEVEDRMVERYRDKLVLQRAETIARNETLRASSEGQREVWMQARQSGSLRGNERRVWIDTGDARECELCREMSDKYGDDENGVKLDEPYITPDGEAIMVPTEIHIECRCAEGLVPGDDADQDEE